MTGQEGSAKSADPAVAAAGVVVETGDETAITDLSLQYRGHGLRELPSQVFELASTLQSLDLSRNSVAEIPASIARLKALTSLNLSRNQIKVLPVEIGQLTQLVHLNLLSNRLRPMARSLPLKELAALPKLQRLDLRFNEKFKSSATLEILEQQLSGAEVLITIPEAKPPAAAQSAKLHACDRDATLLRSQLEPYSTPTLRRRLRQVFGVDTDPEQIGREEVMRHLLRCYAAQGPRKVRRIRGEPIREELRWQLLHELQRWAATQIQSKTPRERPTIRAQCYTILRSPAEFSTKDSAKAQLAAAKLARHHTLWQLAQRALGEVDPAFAREFTALAVTLNFVGSAHIDTQNIAPFYGCALGDFAWGGGQLCVECSPTEVAYVDTRGRLAKVDGRFPHWVAPYAHGDRYSLIFYRTLGPVAPQTTAVFVKPEPDTEPECMRRCIVEA